MNFNLAFADKNLGKIINFEYVKLKPANCFLALPPLNLHTEANKRSKCSFCSIAATTLTAALQ